MKVDLGKETPESDQATMIALKYALDQLDRDEIDVLTLAPQGPNAFFTEEAGSLVEYLSKRYNTTDIMSILVSEKMKMGFVTEQVKLRDVPHQVTQKNIFKKLTLLDDTLRQDFTILKPKIAVPIGRATKAMAKVASDCRVAAAASPCGKKICGKTMTAAVA